MWPLRASYGIARFVAMNDTDNNDSLALCGKLLIAMPGMCDPRFDRSVIFICDHSDQGTMGLIVNKPAPHVQIQSLLDQLDIPKSESVAEIRVHLGGPVEIGRGFVLHSADYSADPATLQVDANFAMTATLDILKELAAGNGPNSAILMMGYAGWGPGQLADEIAQNGWLICDANPEIVFSDDSRGKWSAALGLLGVDPLVLSATAGRA